LKIGKPRQRLQTLAAVINDILYTIMISNVPKRKPGFIIYLIKFIGIFSLLYFGTIGLIGLSAPGGYYIPFIDHYFNYVSWLRSSLLYASKAIISVAGFENFIKQPYNLEVIGGRGIHIGYDCLGYGVLSFWAAFIMANPGTKGRKAKWMVGGLLLIWCINVMRISLLLIAINKAWPAPLSLDHHAWFNIASYTCIFTCIYFYDRSGKVNLQASNAPQ
jgi:exosortase/archaeosortase family protein